MLKISDTANQIPLHKIMTKIRPFLKWAGSKYNCLNEILLSLPSGKRLIEPFAGSGVIFMNTHYSSYLLAESNPDLISIFSTLQTQGDEFINYSQQFFSPAFNNKDLYYEIRTEFNQLSASPKKSAYFLYLNRHGFNGLCRYNSKGLYNVPFGLYTKPYFPSQEMMLFYQKSMQANFIHNDFRNTFAMARKGDVIYCDPPYVPLNSHTQSIPYTPKPFSEADQIDLAELAGATAARGIPVIISNHDTEFTRYHYQKAEIRSFPVSRYINCQVNLRQPVKELVAIFKR